MSKTRCPQTSQFSRRLKLRKYTTCTSSVQACNQAYTADWVSYSQPGSTCTDIGCHRPLRPCCAVLETPAYGILKNITAALFASLCNTVDPDMGWLRDPCTESCYSTKHSTESCYSTKHSRDISHERQSQPDVDSSCTVISPVANSTHMHLS